MDDLNNDPELVADDIIKQATGMGSKEEAKRRIVDILKSYHQLQSELAKFKKQQETESCISYDGNFAWKTVKGQKDGPYCARCHSIGKGLIRLIDNKHGSWHCCKCGMTFDNFTYQKPDDHTEGCTWMAM